MPSIYLKKVLLVFIALSGVFSVLFGAWLAHAGQGLIESDRIRLITAHQYQVIHTLALLSVFVFYCFTLSKALLISSLFFILGILAFSGSLYLKTYTGIEVMGKLAPLGGVMLAVGWLSLIFVSKEKL